MSNIENQSPTGSLIYQKILFLDIDGVLNSEEYFSNNVNTGKDFSGLILQVYHLLRHWRRIFLKDSDFINLAIRCY